MEDELMSVERAAQYAGGLSKWTIHAWLSKRKIPRTKVGGRTMIRRSALDAYIVSCNLDALKTDQVAAPGSAVSSNAVRDVDGYSMENANQESDSEQRRGPSLPVRSPKSRSQQELFPDGETEPLDSCATGRLAVRSLDPLSMEKVPKQLPFARKAKDRKSENQKPQVRESDK